MALGEEGIKRKVDDVKGRVRKSESGCTLYIPKWVKIQLKIQL